MNRWWSFKPYTDQSGQRWVDGQGWLIALGFAPLLALVFT
jgi:hypothetical protein